MVFARTANELPGRGVIPTEPQTKMIRPEESKPEFPFTLIGWGLALQLALPSAITLVYPVLRWRTYKRQINNSRS